MSYKSVVVTHFINPHKFWYHQNYVPNETYDKIVELEKQIEKIEKENEEKPAIGALVAVKYLPWKKFIRARVGHIDVPDGEIIMWAIDHGFPFQTKRDLIFRLPQKFTKLIEVVHLGGLVNIFPADNTGKWSKEACEEMEKQLREARNIEVLEHFSIDNYSWVELRLRRYQREKYCFRKFLISMGLATDSGKNFREIVCDLDTTKFSPWLTNEGNYKFRHNDAKGNYVTVNVEAGPKFPGGITWYKQIKQQFRECDRRDEAPFDTKQGSNQKGFSGACKKSFPGCRTITSGRGSFVLPPVIQGENLRKRYPGEIAETHANSYNRTQRGNSKRAETHSISGENLSNPSAGESNAESAIKVTLSPGSYKKLMKPLPAGNDSSNLEKDANEVKQCHWKATTVCHHEPHEKETIIFDTPNKALKEEDVSLDLGNLSSSNSKLGPDISTFAAEENFGNDYYKSLVRDNNKDNEINVLIRIEEPPFEIVETDYKYEKSTTADHSPMQLNPKEYNQVTNNEGSNPKEFSGACKKSLPLRHARASAGRDAGMIAETRAINDNQIQRSNNTSTDSETHSNSSEKSSNTIVGEPNVESAVKVTPSAVPAENKPTANYEFEVFPSYQIKLPRINELQEIEGEWDVKTQCVQNFVLAHSKIALHMIENLSDVPFCKEIYDEMRNLQITKLYRIQAYSWSHLFRENSLFIVNPPRSGKTWSYLPVVCNLVMFGVLNYSCPHPYGPMGVILVPSSSHVEEISMLCKSLLRDVRPPVSTVVSFGVRNVNEVKIALLNSCGLLIATPTSFLRLLEDNEKESLIDFKRLRHLVIDDMDLMIRHSKNELVAVVDTLFKMCMQSIQLVVTSRDWNPTMLAMIRKSNHPLLLMGDFLQAAVYGKVKISISLCQSKKKIDAIRQFIGKNSLASKHLLILCNSDDDVSQVTKALEASNYIYIGCSSDTSVEELAIANEWKKEKVGSPRILVCTDAIFSQLQIQNVRCVIHYSMPNSWRKFTTRFCAHAETYENRVQNNFETTNPTEKNSQSLILLNEEINIQLPRLIHFLKKHNRQKCIPNDILAVSKRVLLAHEAKRLSQGAGVCPHLMEFGECDEVHCDYRHNFSSSDVFPKTDDIPVDGDIRILIQEVFSPTHYSALVLQHRTTGSTEWRDVRRSNEVCPFGMQMNQSVDIRLLGVVPFDNERTWDCSATMSVKGWLIDNVKKEECVLASVVFALANTIWVKNIIVIEKLPSVGQSMYLVNVKHLLHENRIAAIVDEDHCNIKNIAEECGLLVHNNEPEIEPASGNESDTSVSDLIKFSSSSETMDSEIETESLSNRKLEHNQNDIVDWDRSLRHDSNERKEIYVPIPEMVVDDDERNGSNIDKIASHDINAEWSYEHFNPNSNGNDESDDEKNLFQTSTPIINWEEQ